MRGTSGKTECGVRVVVDWCAVWLLAAIALALCVDGTPAQAQKVREDFWATNGAVTSAVVAGKTLYLAGDFTGVGPAAGGGVPVDPTTGDAAPGYPKVAGTVFAVGPDGSGGWYIGGTFTSVGGQARHNLAHILADQRVAPWDPGADGPVYALAVSGTTVYVGGQFTHAGGQSRARLVAIDAATGAATAWNPNPSTRGFTGVLDLAVSGSTVYACGDFSRIGGQSRRWIAGVDAQTGLATAFDIGDADHLAYALAADGGTLYVAGDFTQIGGQLRNGIAALDASTGAVTSWNANCDGSVYAIQVSGPTVYALGQFLHIGGQARSEIAAVDASTALATSWNPDLGPDNFGAVNLEATLAVTATTVYAGAGRLVAFDRSTAQLAPWDPRLSALGQFGTVVTQCLAVAGGRMYVGGSFATIGGVTRNHFAAIDVRTGMPTEWDPHADGIGFYPPGFFNDYVLAVRGATVYALGPFQHIGGQPRDGIAALDSRTGLATSWNPGSDIFETVGGYGTLPFAAALDENRLYVGGPFTTIGGQPRSGLAALDLDTGLATAWDPQMLGYCYALALSPDRHTVYAAGQFDIIGGQQRHVVAALDAITGLATNWNPNASGGDYTGRALAVSKNAVYVGGGFTSIGGEARRGLAALDAGTGSATAWNPDPDPHPGFGVAGPVSVLAAEGKLVYAGGGFSNIGGRQSRRLAALDAETGLALDWNPDVDGSVAALAFGPDVVYAGGGFGAIGGTAQSNLAAIEAAQANHGKIHTPAGGEQLVGGSTTVVTWDPLDGASSVTLLLSLDGGVTWKIEQQSIPNTGSYEWRVASVATTEARLEIKAIYDTGAAGLEFAVSDGFSIATPTGVGGGPATLALRPENPVVGPFAVGFSLVSAERAVLAVYDIGGRQVVSREVGSSGPGWHMVKFGNLPAGMYLVRLSQAGRSLSSRMVVLR